MADEPSITPESITPETKVAALLERYPQLEDLLVALAPPFAKLRNPLLRRSVAKVASLRQAAAVARLPVGALVDELRAAVGQPPLGAREGPEEGERYLGPPPRWYDPQRVVETLVEAELDTDAMPLAPLARRARALAPGEIVELVTTHVPAPGVDALRRQGFVVWCREDGERIRTYVARP